MDAVVGSIFSRLHPVKSHQLSYHIVSSSSGSRDSDVLRGLKRSFCFWVNGHAGRAEGVIADLGLDAGGDCAALDHPVGVLLVRGLAR
jgi:hypothetical protein